MDNILGLAYTVFPFVVIIIIALVVIVLAGLSLARPRMLLYPYLGIIFFVTGNSYGRLEAAASSIYSRGSGVLYFSFMLWLLFALMLWAKFSLALGRNQFGRCNLLPWFSAWAILLVGHIFVGLFFGIPFADIVAPSGISNIVWMGVLILSMLLVFRSKNELNELAKVIVLAGLARGLFGLVRWIAFGGDPANAYANRHGLDLKLTFFDINDSLVCWLAISIAAVNLFRSSNIEYSRLWRFIFLATIIACAACIILSFRRTVWIGVLLGSLFILVNLPSQRRIQFLLIGAPPVLVGLVYSAWKRLSQTKGATGLGDFFFDVQSRSIGAESPRLLELKLAWADFIDHPIFGIGSWGRYKGHELISWQTGEYGGTFLHSGVLHIALKSGFIGLILIAGLTFAFIRFWRTQKNMISREALPLAIAGVSGVLFMLPDLIIGTPITQIRTMQMIAFCLSLPYVAARLTQSNKISSVMETSPSRNSNGLINSL